MSYKINEYSYPSKTTLFSDKFLFNFSNNNLEDLYVKHKLNEPTVWKNIFFSFSFLLTLAIFIVFMYFNFTNTVFQNTAKNVLPASYFFIAVSVVNLIVGLIAQQKKEVFPLQIFFLWLNLFTLQCSFLCLRYFLFAYLQNANDAYFNPQNNLIKDLVNFGDFAITFCYILTVDNKFSRVFFALIEILIVYLIIMMTSNYTLNSAFDLVIYSISRIILMAIAYLAEYLMKSLFFYSNKLIKKSDMLTSTLNHIKSGMIVYNKDQEKIKFINSYAKQFKKFYNSSKKKQNAATKGVTDENLAVGTIQDTKNNINIEAEGKYTTTATNLVSHRENKIHIEENFNEEPKDRILSIFKNLYEVSEVISPILKQSFEKLELEEILEHLETAQERYNCFEEFFYIGLIDSNKNNFNKEMSEDPEENLVLEVYMRINRSSYLTFEFIFNDVTKTKSANSEKFKMNQSILSTISNKFLSPIKELNETIKTIKTIPKDKSESTNANTSYYSNEKRIKEESLMANLEHIENLNKYLFLLTKDFDHIHRLENKLPIKVNNEWLDIREEIKTFKKLSKSLIKKYRVTDNIIYVDTIDDSVPKFIYFDRVKLYQILMNLVSNSIRYASSGCIKVKLELVEKSNLPSNPVTDLKLEDKYFLRISVVDYGKNLKKEDEKTILRRIKVSRVLCPIHDSKETNKGYGLWLISHLCRLYGSNIVFYQMLPKSKNNNKKYGCEFHFDLHLKTYIETSNRNLPKADFFTDEGAHLTEIKPNNDGVPFNLRFHTPNIEVDNLQENNIQVEIKNSPIKLEDTYMQPKSNTKDLMKDKDKTQGITGDAQVTAIQQNSVNKKIHLKIARERLNLVSLISSLKTHM